MTPARALQVLALLAAALAACAGPLAAPARAEDPIAAKAREAYDFAGWPARDGPSRDGIDLAAIEAPGLRRVSMDLRAAPGGPVATIHFGAAMVVRVFVEDTPAAAQEALLTAIAGCSRKLDRLGGERARGDVAFGATGDRGGRDFLAFADANICAVIQGPGAFVDALAARVEALVRASPVLEGKQVRTKAEIGKLEAGPRTAGAGPETPLTVEVRGEVRRELAVENGFVREGPDGPTLRPARAGAVRVTLHVLSPRGWRTSASTAVRAD